MFKLGKQVETTLMAIKDLHENPDGLAISHIAKKNNLSKNTLSKLLQGLMNKKFLISAQGVQGGYKLIKPIHKIRFYDLLLALDEIKPLICTTDLGCALEKQCSIKSPLQQWEARFLNFLKETSIEDLISSSNSPHSPNLPNSPNSPNSLNFPDSPNSPDLQKSQKIAPKTAQSSPKTSPKTSHTTEQKTPPKAPAKTSQKTPLKAAHTTTHTTEQTTAHTTEHKAPPKASQKTPLKASPKASHTTAHTTAHTTEQKTEQTNLHLHSISLNSRGFEP